MRNAFPVADFATLFLKNHFELRERLLRGATPLLPFDFALNFGALPHASAMRMTSANGMLELHFADGPRSFTVRTPVAHLAGDAAQLEVTMDDGTGSKTQKVAAPSLALLPVPQAFTALRDKVVKHLQSLFPAAAGRAKPAETGAQPEGAANGGNAAQGPAAGDGGAEVSADAKDEYSWYVVQRLKDPDLRFRGKLLTSCQSLPFKGRFYVFSVFETPSGKLVATKRGVSYWMTEHDTVEVGVFDKREELAGFFGFSPLAKALYEDLGLRTEEVVE